jgi:cellobiose-specific phosphotransferase system component IIB
MSTALLVTDIIKSAIEKSDNVSIVKLPDGTSEIRCERKATKTNPFGGKSAYPVKVNSAAEKFEFELHPKLEASVAASVKAVYENDTLEVTVDKYSEKDGVVVNAVYFDLLRKHVKATEPTKIRLLVGVVFA